MIFERFLENVELEIIRSRKAKPIFKLTEEEKKILKEEKKKSKIIKANKKKQFLEKQIEKISKKIN